MRRAVADLERHARHNRFGGDSILAKKRLLWTSQGGGNGNVRIIS